MIGAYRKLWQHRSSAAEAETMEDVGRLIRTELNDELTHPRLRRPLDEKLAIALARIEESELTAEEKRGLADYYKEMAADMQRADQG